MSEPALPPIRDLSPLSARRALSTCSSSAFRTYITARFQDAQSLGLNRVPPPAEHLLPSAASDASGSGGGGGGAGGTAQLLPRLVMSRAGAQEGSREDGARRLSLDVYASRRQAAEGAGDSANRGSGGGDGEVGAMGLRDDELSAKAGRFTGHMAAIRRLQGVRRADLVAALLSDSNWPAGLAMDDRVKLDQFAALFPSHSYRNSRSSHPSSASASLSASLVAGVPVFAVTPAAQCGGNGRWDKFSNESCLLSYYAFLQMLFLDVFWASLAAIAAAAAGNDAALSDAWDGDTARERPGTPRDDSWRSPTAAPGTPRARATPRSPAFPPASPRSSHVPFPASPKLSPSAAASAAGLAPSGPALQRSAVLVPRSSCLGSLANAAPGEGERNRRQQLARRWVAMCPPGSDAVEEVVEIVSRVITRLRADIVLEAAAAAANGDASGGGPGWRGGDDAQRWEERETEAVRQIHKLGCEDVDRLLWGLELGRSSRDGQRKSHDSQEVPKEASKVAARIVSVLIEGVNGGRGVQAGAGGAEGTGASASGSASAAAGGGKAGCVGEGLRGTLPPPPVRAAGSLARNPSQGDLKTSSFFALAIGAERMGENVARLSSGRLRDEKRETEREARKEAEREELQRRQQQWRKGDDPSALSADTSRRFEKTLFGGGGDGGAGGGEGGAGGAGMSRLRSLSPLRSTSPHRPLSPMSPYRAALTAAPMFPYRAPEAALPPAPMTPRSPVLGGDSSARTADGGRSGREQRWREMAQKEMNEISPGRFPPVSPRAVPPGSPYQQPSAALQSPRAVPMSPHANRFSSPHEPVSPRAPMSPLPPNSPLASAPPSPYAPMSPYAGAARGGVSPASPATTTPVPSLAPLKLPPGRSMAQQQQQQPNSPLAAEAKPSPWEAQKPPAMTMPEPRTPTAAAASAGGAGAAPSSPVPRYYQSGASPRYPSASAPHDAGVGGGYRSPANAPAPALSPYQRSVSPVPGAAAAAGGGAVPMSPRPSDSNKSSSLYRSSPTRHERFKMLYQKQKQQRPGGGEKAAARPSPRYTPSQLPQPPQQQMPAWQDTIPRCVTPPRETPAKLNSFQPSPLLLPTAPAPRSPSPQYASPAALSAALESPQSRRFQEPSVQAPASPLRPAAPNLPEFELLDALSSPRDMLLPPPVSPFQKGRHADVCDVSPPRGSLLPSTPRNHVEEFGNGGGADEAKQLNAYSARRAPASPLQGASSGWNNTDPQSGKESFWDAADKGGEGSRTASRVEADTHAGRSSPLRSSRSWRRLVPTLGKIRGVSPRRLADPDEIPPVEPDVKFQQVQQWLWSQPDNPGEDEEEDHWRAQERAAETSEASQTSPGEQPEVTSTSARGGQRGMLDGEERRRRGMEISRPLYGADERENELVRGSLRVSAISTSKVMQERANIGVFSPDVSPRTGAGTGWKKVMGLGTSNRSPDRARKSGSGRLLTVQDPDRVENKAEQYRLFRSGSPLRAVLRRGAP
ncbi:unnamed protein product [Closterium sp. NIES-54]